MAFQSAYLPLVNQGEIATHAVSDVINTQTVVLSAQRDLVRQIRIAGVWDSQLEELPSVSVVGWINYGAIYPQEHKAYIMTTNTLGQTKLYNCSESIVGQNVFTGIINRYPQIYLISESSDIDFTKYGLQPDPEYVERGNHLNEENQP